MGLTTTLPSAIKNSIDSRLQQVYTTIPAVIVSVDYRNNNCVVKPLLRTKRVDGTQYEMPQLHDVPLFILSGNLGKARVTIPVSAGDTVLLLFSQRDLGGFLESDGKTVQDTDSIFTHGINPIMALPCLFTQSTAKPIDSKNIVIENGKSKITMSPSGEVTVSASDLKVNCSGTVDINASTIEANGLLKANSGLEVTGTMTNDGVSVGATHTHTGVTTGGGTTGPVSP